MTSEVRRLVLLVFKPLLDKQNLDLNVKDEVYASSSLFLSCPTCSGITFSYNDPFLLPTVYCRLFLHPAGVFRGFENLVGVLDAVGGWCLRVLEGVVDCEFLVFAKRECVVGQYFDSLDVAECADEVPRACERFVVVADARDEYVADPNGLLDAVEVTEKIDDVFVTVAREFFVRDGIDVLDVNEQEVCRFHQSFDFRELFAGASKRDSACVDAGVDSCSFCRLEELNHKLDLR